ncbi:DUF4406 domain-containing protein [Aeromonas salmonicida]|uniref:DUF4406 domain-containing protein n=1 Tax=Aeromonas salmonicida TaxID=645 RepID=UPI00259DF19D|nr:DUF4406 domain-containing protein [Aeromonas salmonicida]MDM5067278.1 DUF4406 domain-containing protein [Aeromonas salmonicida]
MTNKPVAEAGLILLEGVKVYVAGPMTGLPEFNRPTFFAAEEHLKSLGAQVMTPAILPDGWSHEAYMRIAIPMLMECEAVAFLPGWQQSSSARREFTRAQAFGLDLYQLSVCEVAGQFWISGIALLDI